jgi:apolipoprotein N-acyltransferase
VDVAANVPRDKLTPKYRAELSRLQTRIRSTGGRYGSPALLGLESVVWFRGEEHPRKYNSALLIQTDKQVAGRYDKVHRVPFGEFVPFREQLPWMDTFNAYGYDFGVNAGEGLSRLPLDKYHFGVLICYEDTDPTLARAYSQESTDGPPVNFLVNISNDGWFDGTSEHDEHLAICRFRAIEARRAVVRSVNMGISAVIDGNGRVLRPVMVEKKGKIPVWEIEDCCAGPELSISEWHRFKKVEGVLTSCIPLDQRASLYASWGDWLPWTCWMLVAAGLVWAYFRRPAWRLAHASALR